MLPAFSEEESTGTKIKRYLASGFQAEAIAAALGCSADRVRDFLERWRVESDAQCLVVPAQEFVTQYYTTRELLGDFITRYGRLDRRHTSLLAVIFTGYVSGETLEQIAVRIGQPPDDIQTLTGEIVNQFGLPSAGLPGLGVVFTLGRLSSTLPPPLKLPPGRRPARAGSVLTTPRHRWR